MPEQVDLTAAIVPPSVTYYRVASLFLDWVGARIVVVLRGTNNEETSVTYNGAEALSLMSTLNTANLSSNSLHKRVLNKIISDGKVAGTVSGSPV